MRLDSIHANLLLVCKKKTKSNLDLRTNSKSIQLFLQLVCFAIEFYVYDKSGNICLGVLIFLWVFFLFELIHQNLSCLVKAKSC